MHCIVTAGPTYEPIDGARRITNFSTGRLGTELANHLQAAGHHVTLLLSETASYRGEPRVAALRTFGTTASLAAALRELASPEVRGVFHAAAVSDFTVRQVLRRAPDGALVPVKAGKLPSDPAVTLLAELSPTPKIILSLRADFPRAHIVGWKYEVEGDPARLLVLARAQIERARVDGTVVNGPAYGPGFGWVPRPGLQMVHQSDAAALFDVLAQSLAAAAG